MELNKNMKYVKLFENFTAYKVIDAAGKILNANRPKIGDLEFFLDIPSGHWCWGNKNITIYASPDFVEEGKMSMGTQEGPSVDLETPKSSDHQDFASKYVELVKANINKVK